MTTPKSGAAPVPLLFGFRGIRWLQAVVAIAAGALAIAGVLTLKAYIDDRAGLLLMLTVVYAVLFLWLFGMALRLPTSFVAISPERMRIRFGGFTDSLLETREVAGARLVNWSWWKGLGVRTGFGGDVALVAAWGPAVELTLKQPIRVWLIPRLWRVRATRVTLSVRNPQKMVERFGPATAQPTPTATGKRKRR